MAYLRGKTVFKLLLIITMMIQPVAISYAMASMDHFHYQSSVSTGGGHDARHLMNAEIPGFQHGDHDGADGGVLNDCCDTAVCSPAAVAEVEMMLHLAVPTFSVPLLVSWAGVALPAEIKPPRYLLC